MTWNLCDRLEIESVVRNFYAKANTICRVYKQCSLGIKLSLFDTFCMNFYLIHLCFSYPQYVYNRLRVATNNMLRKLVGLPRFCSASEMYVYLRIDDLDSRIRKIRAGFYSRILSCENTISKNFVCSDAFISCPLYLKICEQTIAI